MTPNDIEILIHYHVSPEPHPRLSAPAVQQSLKILESHNLVERTAVGYITTSRGAAHVKQLCSTPFPKKMWVDADNRVISIEGETNANGV